VIEEVEVKTFSIFKKKYVPQRLVGQQFSLVPSTISVSRGAHTVCLHFLGLHTSVSFSQPQFRLSTVLSHPSGRSTWEVLFNGSHLADSQARE
jgi:hypothetical protein